MISDPYISSASNLTYKDESIAVTSVYHISHNMQKKMGVKILKSRLWAKDNGLGRKDDIVQSIELEDDNLYPNELESCRSQIGPEGMK